jgi:hypothetical protein
MTTTPAPAAQDNYVVAYFDTKSWVQPIGPVRVHVQAGHTTKDTQDRIAEILATDPRPHLIYTVMLEADFYAYYRGWLEERFTA